MLFDPMALAENIEAASPTLAKKMTMVVLGLVSPFNRHLRGRLLEWKKNKVRIQVACHRGVRNHVGSIHAGALFTLGETCAGLIIIKNFNFKDHRPLMSKVSVVYDKQARGRVTGVCEISSQALAKALGELKNKKIPFIPMRTLILDGKNQTIAEVKTVWQVKPWKDVRPVSTGTVLTAERPPWPRRGRRKK